MSGPPDNAPTDARLRAALIEHLEAVMTVTDTERELHRFRLGIGKRSVRSRLLAVAATAVVGAALVGAFLTVRQASTPGLFGNPSTSSLTGEMDLVIQDYRNVDLSRSDQTESRDGVVVGTITLDAGKRRTGDVRMDMSASSVTTGAGPLVQHAWGTITATIDGATCTGTYGYSYYFDPQEAGGALQLMCTDGSALGARMAVTEEEPIDGTNDWRLRVSLDDGFRIEG